jgi:hypothetical protein
VARPAKGFPALECLFSVFQQVQHMKPLAKNKHKNGLEDLCQSWKKDSYYVYHY